VFIYVCYLTVSIAIHLYIDNNNGTVNLLYCCYHSLEYYSTRAKPLVNQLCHHLRTSMFNRLIRLSITLVMSTTWTKMQSTKRQFFIDWINWWQQTSYTKVTNTWLLFCSS